MLVVIIINGFVLRIRVLLASEFPKTAICCSMFH